MAKRTRKAVQNLGRAIDWTTSQVRDVHVAIAKQPYRVLSHVPMVAEGAALVEPIHTGITKATYEIVRAVAKGVVAVVDGAVAIADLPDPAFDDKGAIAILNAVAGHEMDLGVTMSFASVPADLSGHVVIFVHGLACDDTCWFWYAGDGTSYGTRLQAAHGITPLYARYNSGLAIEANGVAFAELVDRLMTEHPAITKLSLVGHSMGGLVISRAIDEKCAWNDRVAHIACLGSPHLGAPLAKLGEGAAIALATFDVTMPFSRILESRSTGVKGLMDGYASLTQLPDARVLVVMSSGFGLLGDGLVPEGSASAITHHEKVVIERGHHGTLLNDPEVYGHVERLLTTPA